MCLAIVRGQNKAGLYYRDNCFFCVNCKGGCLGVIIKIHEDLKQNTGCKTVHVSKIQFGHSVHFVCNHKKCK